MRVFNVFGSGQKRNWRPSPFETSQKAEVQIAETRDKLMRFEPVELSLPHFSVSQLAGLWATTKQAILSETHLTD